MNKYEGLCCPVCHAKFFEDDDIVVCPVCGAPHHRDCYKYEGHCYYEQSHGTPDQWKMPEAAEPKLYCKRCGKQMDADKDVCPSCGAAQTAENQSQTDGEPFGGGFAFGGFPPPNGEFSADGSNPFNPDPAKMYNINADEVIDDGVTAGDVLNFTGPQGLRYLNVYKRQLGSGSRLGWNWVAFLFPEIWLCSRKVWFLAVPALIINAVLSAMTALVLSPYMQNTVSYFSVAESLTNDDMMVVGMFSLCILAIKIFFGMFGDYFYRSHSFKKIRALKSENRAERLDLLQAGSVNVLFIFLSYFASNALVQLVAALLQNFKL